MFFWKPESHALGSCLSDRASLACNAAVSWGCQNATLSLKAKSCLTAEMGWNTGSLHHFPVVRSDSLINHHRPVGIYHLCFPSYTNQPILFTPIFHRELLRSYRVAPCSPWGDSCLTIQRTGSNHRMMWSTQWLGLGKTLGKLNQ